MEEVWPHSMVPACSASRICSGGTISPAAKGWMRNLLSVICATRFERYSMPP
jgi:hypothetical protein